MTEAEADARIVEGYHVLLSENLRLAHAAILAHANAHNDDSGFQPQDHAMLIRRFEREVRYQQMVDHPNVVPIFQYYLAASPPWFVIPLAAGSLKDDLEADRTLGVTSRKVIGLLLE